MEMAEVLWKLEKQSLQEKGKGSEDGGEEVRATAMRAVEEG